MPLYSKQIQNRTMLTVVFHEMTIPFTVQVIVAQPSTRANRLVLKQSSAIHDYMKHIDRVFSPFREDSELTAFNQGSLMFENTSQDFQTVYAISSWAEEKTNHLFSADYLGTQQYDPTGLVKGWAIEQAAKHFLFALLAEDDFIAANLIGGGDMQFATRPGSDWVWQLAIADPFDTKKIMAKLAMTSGAIASSGTVERGQHLINVAQHRAIGTQASDIISGSVISDSLAEADIWATAVTTTSISDHRWLKELDGSGMRISYGKIAERWQNNRIVDQKELIYA
ncbi:MAG: FAD:protein FMN transferase [Oenococcus sp.]|uniref:FAD:protein FMN transferase n=1 Tax=Oenococcus sp. TaxID=1979414 RepID=UPI0039EA5CD1